MHLRSSATVALALHLLTGHAETLQVAFSGREFSGTHVLLDQKFVGLAADVFEVPSGTRELRFSSSTGHEFFVILKVSPGAIQVQSVGNEPRNCGPALTVDWATPTIDESARKNGILRLVVADPAIAPSSEPSMCVSPSMAMCDMRKLALAATTKPAGAEVWLDGKKLPQRTDVNLSVPFCPHEKSKSLVFRYPGHINCERQFALSADADITASCEMKRVVPAAK
jgi:hypothetical protein